MTGKLFAKGRFGGVDLAVFNVKVKLGQTKSNQFFEKQKRTEKNRKEQIMAWKAGWPSMGAKIEDDSLTPRLGWTGWGKQLRMTK